MGLLGLEVSAWAYLVATMCTVTAIIVTMLTITQHLLQTRQPQLRNYTIRVLLMVPIYATEALFGLVLRDFSEIIEVFRECYEAFTLLSFMQLMLAYLSLESAGPGGNVTMKVAMDMKNQPTVPHIWPFNFLPPWEMGHIFLRNTLLGVFQYCAVMLGVTFVSMLAWVLGFYNAESFSFGSAYTYLAFMQSASQCYALYCLVLFYQASKQKLAAIHPLHKFVCIKLVVFFTFWQEILIACAVHVGFITNESLDEGYEKMPSNYWSTSEIANGLNDFMICVEMLGFAIAHVYVFPPMDYMRAERMSVKLMRREDDPDSYHEPYKTLLFEDPEAHVTENRVVHGNFQNGRMVKQLIQGINFLDLMNDIQAMKELHMHTTQRQEQEPLCNKGYGSTVPSPGAL